MTGDLSEHFNRWEFRCPCCGGDTVDYELLNVLEKLHFHFGKIYGSVKVGINSGYRCSSRNREVGGSDKSQHLYGRAVDLVVYRKVGEEWLTVNPNSIVNYLEESYPGMYGIGAYPSWTHIDTRTRGPARWTG